MADMLARHTDLVHLQSESGQTMCENRRFWHPPPGMTDFNAPLALASAVRMMAVAATDNQAEFSRVIIGDGGQIEFVCHSLYAGSHASRGDPRLGRFASPSRPQSGKSVRSHAKRGNEEE